MEDNFLKHLIEQFKKLPGVTLKHSEKIVFALLQNDTLLTELKDAFYSLEKIEKCDSCGWMKKKGTECDNCESSKKESSIICVVESFSEKLAIEKKSDYKGTFHILGGVISPLEGILPEDLLIAPLVRKIKDGKTTEVIFATPSSIELEATIQYILDFIGETEVTLSRIARGIPTGSKLEHMDRSTISHAVHDRQKVV